MKHTQTTTSIIVGSGIIGGKLKEILGNRGHKVAATATQRFVVHEGGKNAITPASSFKKITAALAPFCKKAEFAFVAIPTKDKGENALKYIQFFLSKGMRVITAEKGSLAYHYATLFPYLSKIGRAAACGGGTDMVHDLVRRRLWDEDVTVSLVINGTLNYIWSGLNAGRSFGAVVNEAKRHGYAEPGNSDPVGLINGEIGGDLRKKICVAGNEAFAPRGGPFWHPDKISFKPVKKSDLTELASPGRRYRYIVRIAIVPFLKEYGDNSPGRMSAKFGRWYVSGGFHNIAAGSPMDTWLRGVDGVNNGLDRKSVV